MRRKYRVTEYNLNGLTYDEFLDFVFVRFRRVYKRAFRIHCYIKYDSDQIVQFFIRLFHDPATLLDRYNYKQLQVTFWHILDNATELSLKKFLWDDNLSIATREEYVRSMYDLFARLFSIEPLPFDWLPVYMWWDALAYPFHMLQADRTEGVDESTIQERYGYLLGENGQRIKQVMFETLSRILQLDAPLCQIAAIHGLGHLFHPDTPQVLLSYLEKHKEPAESVANYYEAHSEYIMRIVHGERIM